jgi:hypothetical protein
MEKHGPIEIVEIWWFRKNQAEEEAESLRSYGRNRFVERFGLNYFVKGRSVHMALEGNYHTITLKRVYD